MLLPPVSEAGDGYYSSAPYDRSRLQAAILFWDALENPLNRGMEWVDPSLDEMQALGLLTRSEAVVSGAIDGDISWHVAAAVFDAVNKSSPGRWSFSQALGAEMPDEFSINRGGLQAALNNAIALPEVNVPFAEIAEFRHKRHAELQSLRFHIDGLAETIAASADSERAFASRIDQLDQAVRDHLLVSRERFTLLRRVSIAPTFSLTDGLKSGYSALRGGLLGGLPLTDALWAGLGAGVAGAINLDIKPAYKRAASAGPFAYVVHAHRDLQGPR